MPPPGRHTRIVAGSSTCSGTKTSDARRRTPASSRHSDLEAVTSRARVRRSNSLMSRLGRGCLVGLEPLRQDDRLRLEVLGEALGTELPTEAGVLETAERRREVHAHAVHAVRAGAHA